MVAGPRPCKIWFFLASLVVRLGLAGRGLVDIMHPDVGP